MVSHSTTKLLPLPLPVPAYDSLESTCLLPPCLALGMLMSKDNTRKENSSLCTSLLYLCYEILTFIYKKKKKSKKKIKWIEQTWSRGIGTEEELNGKFNDPIVSRLYWANRFRARLLSYFKWLKVFLMQNFLKPVLSKNAN